MCVCVCVCACGHEFGMGNNRPWWLVNQWHGIGMRGSNLLMIGNDELVLILTRGKRGLVMDFGMKFYV